MAESSSQLAIPLSIRKRKSEHPVVGLSDEEIQALEELEQRRQKRENVYASKSKSTKAHHKSQATKLYNSQFAELLDKGLVEEKDRFEERAGLPPASPVPGPQTSSDTLPGASSSPVVPASGRPNKRVRVAPIEEETSSPRPGPSRKQPARGFKSDAIVRESDDEEDAFLTPVTSRSPTNPFHE